MVSNVTSKFRTRLSSELSGTIDALVTLAKHFGRETQSAALGEVSERLVAEYTGARRQPKGTKGHDLIKGDQLIEVKSRLIDHWGDDLQFNFGQHTVKAHIAYCLAWRIDEVRRPVLEYVFEVGVPVLVGNWGTPMQKGYSARTTLRSLKKAALGKPFVVEPN